MVLVHRLLTAVQMLGVAALAVNVHHGLDESSAGFALSYAAVRAVLVVEYIWAGQHVIALVAGICVIQVMLDLYTRKWSQA